MDDWRDGIILLKVLDHFKPGIVNWKQVSNKTNSRIFIIQNCNYVVEICNKLGAVLVGVGGIDIVDGSDCRNINFDQEIIRQIGLHIAPKRIVQ